MVKSLVGYTGFVGSNLNASEAFTNVYNSKNIEEAYGTKPDLLIYAGVRAEKYLANAYPEKDLEVVKEAFENIKRIQPKKLVLISTIDVYKEPNGMDEDAVIDIEDLHAYGLNRYYLEEWVREEFKDCLIVRLPGLYGQNIKKNFIYDYIHIIPAMLKEEKLVEVSEKDEFIKECYELQENGFYKCRTLEESERVRLKAAFKKVGFTALNFTDSRGEYQFYNLAILWKHIQMALEHSIPLLNLATEPISISELYEYMEGTSFNNEIAPTVASYDYRTKYADLFGGREGYIFDKAYIKEDIKQFIQSQL